MSHVDLEGSLQETVDRLSVKAQRARDAKNLEARIQQATANIQDLTRELYRLEKELKTLRFHDGVATNVFEQARPSEVESALEAAQEVADIDTGELLDAAESETLRKLKDEVTDVIDDLADARSVIIEERINDRRTHWKEEIAAARDLNQLVGGGDSGFEKLLAEFETFLDEEISDESKAPTTLATRWDRLRSKWEEHAGRHGWEEFQAEHGLADETVEALKQFASKKHVRLDELSISVLEDLKGVEELDSAIRLEIDTQ